MIKTFVKDCRNIQINMANDHRLKHSSKKTRQVREQYAPVRTVLI